MASSQDRSPAPAGSTPDNRIATPLERALQNLNVNLEDELARYRRQRHGRVPPPPPPRRKAQRQTIDLISVSASPSEPAVSSPAPGPSAPPTPPPAPPNPFLRGEPDPVADSDLDLSDVDQLLETQQPDDPEQGSDTQDVAKESALPVATDTAPEGYLESSEELLKSLADDQTEPESVPEPYSPDRKNNGLLKLAGLVLVLLAGIGVGFAITYPSQLQKLRSQLFPNATSPDTATTPEGTADATGTASGSTDRTPGSASSDTTTADSYKPPGPDLSQREFVELDLESLSTLDVDKTAPSASVPPLANPAQSPLPQPGTSPTSQNNTSGATTPNQTSTTAPGATAPNAAAAPNSTAPVPAPTQTAASTTTGSNFYVVASYTGDDSLNKARELVPDAFIRNFDAGARIQLAAFDNRAQAEDQVAFLTQQGMTVELFGPTNE